MITNIDEQNRIRLSLQIKNNALKSYETGTIITGKISSKDKLCFTVDLDNNSSISLPRNEFMDCIVKPDSIFLKNVVKKGNNVRILVLDGEKKKLTAKPALLIGHQYNMLPSKIDEVSIGCILVGCVSNISNKFGVFVSFLNGLTGLAPKDNITDEFITEFNDFYQKGQTVLATVTNMDLVKNHILLSLKPSILKIPHYLSLCFLEQQRLPSTMCGKNVDGEIISITPLGFEIIIEYLSQNEKKIAMKAKGFCPMVHIKKPSKFKKTDKILCHVVDLDMYTGIFNLSMRKNLIKGGNITEKKRKSLQEKAITMKNVAAIVELIKPTYAVLSLIDFKSILAVAPLSSFNGKLFGINNFEINSKTNLLPIKCENHIILGDFIPSKSSEQHTELISSLGSYKSNLLTDRKYLQVDTIVYGTIRSIRSSWIYVSLHNIYHEKAEMRLSARIHVTDIQKPNEELINSGISFFDRFKEGDLIEAKVISIQSQVIKGINTLCVNLAPSIEANTFHNPEQLLFENLHIGQKIFAYVDKVNSDRIIVAVSREIRGFIYCTQVSMDLNILEEVFIQSNPSTFKIGSVILATIIDMHPGYLELSMIY